MNILVMRACTDESPGAIRLCVLNKAIKQGRKVTVLLSDNLLLHQELFLQAFFRLCDLSSSFPNLMLKKNCIFLSSGVFEEISGMCLALTCRLFCHATENFTFKDKVLKLSQNTMIPAVVILRRINKQKSKLQ